MFAGDFFLSLGEPPGFNAADPHQAPAPLPSSPAAAPVLPAEEQWSFVATVTLGAGGMAMGMATMLDGGDWNMTCIFPDIGNFIIPIDFHIFQRGSNHQLAMDLPPVNLNKGKPGGICNNILLYHRTL